MRIVESIQWNSRRKCVFGCSVQRVQRMINDAESIPYKKMLNTPLLPLTNEEVCLYWAHVLLCEGCSV